tara:strand:+ start:2537 stop:3679 length:1143 start_codon:yes stop_codon:yes gene_type:complete
VIINSQKRSFGIGSKVSLFTLGTMRALDDPRHMCNMIKNAHYAGINHLETAPSYGNSEAFIGEAIDLLDKVDNISKREWVITTKVLPKKNFRELREDFFNSLNNLKLERINNLAIHGINLPEHLEWVLEGEGHKFIMWLLNQNLIDQIGFSSHGDFQLINHAINSGIFNFCSLHLHLFDQSKFPLARKAIKKNMGVMAISPADKGGKLFLPSDILKEASRPFHPLELAYRFLLSEGISTLSLGASKPDDFNLPIKLANASHKLSQLENEVIANIEIEANKRLGETKCEQCRACLPCPNEVPIPEILRLRNIYIGNGQKEFARERYNLIGRAGHWWETKNANDCLGCNFCVPKCPNNLDIPALLKQTHELLVDKPKRRLWG